jgi:hypothetical protein
MKRGLLFVGIFAIGVSTIFAQVFEEPKQKSEDFTKIKATIGADFALQYQAIDNVGTLASGGEFMPLGSGLNLPTANFTINGMLAPGMKVVLETYLSARHHNEAWVKGGYLLIDDFSFISPSVDNFLNNLTMKAGVMELNYGDGHFRRTDNGAAAKNAFIGNYIMDAFTTAPALEIMWRQSGLLGMIGLTNGNLKPEVVGFKSSGDAIFDANDFVPYSFGKELAIYGKFGFDKQFSDNLRGRLTVSPYYQNYSHRGTLYSGDRAGARFYSVLVPAANGSDATDITKNFTNGRWGPGGTESLFSVMVNPFVKFYGLEFFGLFEIADGATSSADFTYNQLAAELLYRFCKNEQFYVGAKYNNVWNQDDQSVNRLEIAGGWNMTKNIVTKVAYVNQKYDIPTYTKDAGFKGVMVEAAISF